MQAVRTLLDGILDYAGLFPPAKLEMGPAVRNYGRYLAGPESWFLGRLVLPVARFEEFEGEAAALLPKVEGPIHDQAWGITALTAPAGDPQFARDMELIQRFNDRHAAEGAGGALVDCIEVKAAGPKEIDAALEEVLDELFPYFEIAASSDPRGQIAVLAGLDAGAKIRTGGLTKDAHPTPAEVARFLAACAAADVPFKATAGLHHPLRHDAADVGCKQHGFLNVFVGASFLYHEKIDEAACAELLAEESPAAIRIADDGVAWRDRRLTTGELRAARESFAHAFGSCSLEEPLADLKAISLLRAEAATR